MMSQKHATPGGIPHSSLASKFSAAAAVSSCMYRHHARSMHSSRRDRQRLQPLASSYTQEAITAIQHAQQHACREGMFITQQHLLMGLFDLPACTASKLLTSAGLSAAAAAAELLDEGASPMSSGMAAGDLHWAPDARQALNTAAAAAEEAGQSAAGTPHLLLGVLTCRNAAVAALLQHAGVETVAFTEEVWAAARSCHEAAAGHPPSAEAQAAALVQQYQAYVEKHGTAPPQGYTSLTAGSSSSNVGVARTPEDDDIYE